MTADLPSTRSVPPSPWDAGVTPPAGPPPTTTPAPQAARRKRPHPAQKARTVAAAISAGSFLGITGLLIAQHSAASATATTSTAATTSSGSSTSASTTSGSSTNSDDWGATASRTVSNAPGQATTSSHAS